MTRSELRAIAQLSNDRSYIETLKRRDRILASNPSAVARMGNRDRSTGKYSITIQNGGSAQANSITSSSMPLNAVIPSTVLGATNFIDSKPRSQ